MVKFYYENSNGEWKEVTCDLSSAITGVQNLFFTFTGSGTSLFDFDSWQFSEEPTAVNAPRTPRITHSSPSPHDLSGHVVSGQSKGVKIVDGKKIIQ